MELPRKAFVQQETSGPGKKPTIQSKEKGKIILALWEIINATCLTTGHSQHCAKRLTGPLSLDSDKDLMRGNTHSYFVGERTAGIILQMKRLRFGIIK